MIADASRPFVVIRIPSIGMPAKPIASWLRAYGHLSRCTDSLVLNLAATSARRPYRGLQREGCTLTAELTLVHTVDAVACGGASAGSQARDGSGEDVVMGGAPVGGN